MKQKPNTPKPMPRSQDSIVCEAVGTIIVYSAIGAVAAFAIIGIGNSAYNAFRDDPRKAEIAALEKQATTVRDRHDDELASLNCKLNQLFNKVNTLEVDVSDIGFMQHPLISPMTVTNFATVYTNFLYQHNYTLQKDGTWVAN